MSELTTCNSCRLQSIKRDAKKQNKKVVMLPSKYSLGGVEVHVLKKNEKPNKGNWISWMMKVTDRCVC